LTQSFAETQRVGGLASSADTDLDVVIQCLLVGFDEAAKKILKKAYDWLQVAISTEEKPRHYAQDGTEAQRFQTLSLCNWLLEGVHDMKNLQRFVAHEDRFLVASGLSKDKVEIALISHNYLDAGALERALELITKTRGLSLPEELTSIRNEAQMVYVLCRHRLGLDHWSDAELQTAEEKFLTRKMNGWLIDGHFGRAAEWMKIIYWKEGKAGLSPKEAVLKAYDHLPGCSPPEPISQDS